MCVVIYHCINMKLYSLFDANIQASWAPRQCVMSTTVLWMKKEDTIAADPSASVEKEMEQLMTMR